MIPANFRKASARGRLLSATSGHRDRAVGGFFEEIPAFMMVTIGLAIFFISFFNAYTLYAASINAERKSQDGHAFNEAVREWSGFVYDADDNPLAGRYDYNKVSGQTIANITAAIRPGEYNFKIVIDDKSGYDNFISDKTFKTRDVPSKVDVFTVTSPIRIRVSHNEVHCGELTTSIWGFE